MTLRSRNGERNFRNVRDIRNGPLGNMAFHSPIFSGQSV
jgi:hypothetical protein